MKRKPRKIRPNERYQGYDSKFEYDLHRSVLKGFVRDPSYSVDYKVHRKYYPDFIRIIDDFKYYIEAKGRFWDSEEYSKYKHVRECLSGDEEIIFIFYNPDAPMPRSKVKKDGKKTTHGEWATANGFRWFTSSTFKESEL